MWLRLTEASSAWIGEWRARQQEGMGLRDRSMNVWTEGQVALVGGFSRAEVIGDPDQGRSVGDGKTWITWIQGRGWRGNSSCSQLFHKSRIHVSLIAHGFVKKNTNEKCQHEDLGKYLKTSCLPCLSGMFCIFSSDF